MNVYKNEVVENVRQLRLNGLTYNEINIELGISIPKSTMSYLCKGITPGNDYKERIEKSTKQRLDFIRELAVQKNKDIFNKKLAVMRANAQFAPKLMQDKQVAKIALAMLYLGEGSKWKSRRGPALGSSDSRIIRTYLNLLYLCYNVQKESIRCRIQYRADQNYPKLLKYWCEITELSEKQFYIGYIDKRTVGKPTLKSDYKGVCSITCPGTNIQLELDIIADIISDTWGISSVG